MKKELFQLGRQFDEEGINEDMLPTNPFELFENWFQTNLKSEAEDPTAMTISTIGVNGFPESRIVLLKEYSNKGFTFFTNYHSKKGMAIANDNRVSLHFYWKDPARQIRIEGRAEKIDKTESDLYFKSRPFQSQVGAVVSPQSQKIESREILENQYHVIVNGCSEETLKRPENWGGYIVKPSSFEFWHGRASRLHDRIYYQSSSNQWEFHRLAP